MNIYPAIDLYEGKVVRLQKGDFSKMKIYHDRPSETARLWEDSGARWLHLVNLNGARDGKLENLDALKKIKQSVNCRIQFGGGVRKIEDIRILLDSGADRVILGSRALDPRFLDLALNTFPHRVAVGLDVMDGIVRTHGWLAGSGVSLGTALANLNSYAPAAIIVTDIHRDGMLQGPNFNMIEDCLRLSRTPVILSGGVSTLEDIRACTRMKSALFDGAIIGKAIYEYQFTLRDAICIANEKDAKC